MTIIEEFLRNFCACLSVGKMYPATHPQFKNAVDGAFKNMQLLLADKEEIIFGIIEGEIVYENLVLFRLSDILQLLVTHTKKKGVEKIYIYRDSQKEELVSFLAFLLDEKDTSDDPQVHLEMYNVYHIKVGRLTTPDKKTTGPDKEQLSHYETLLKDLNRFYERLLKENFDPVKIQQDLKFIVLSIKDKLAGQYHSCRAEQLKGEHAKSVIRSLNVSILMLTIAEKIDFQPDEIIQAGTAALLYNIASLGTDPAKAKHDDNEKILLLPDRESCHSSACQLLKYTSSFGILPVIVAFELPWLPRGLQEEFLANLSLKPHMISSIIALADFYDRALSRQGSARLSRHELAQLIDSECPGRFAHILLNRFFKILGI